MTHLSPSSAVSPSISFGRDLTPPEWQAYRQAIQSAKQALNIRRLGLITPIRSLPASEAESGIGTLPGAKAFFSFMAALGFDTIQIDPEGKTKLSDPSPYAGTVFSANPLSIDLTPLARDPDWLGLLSPETLDRIVQNNPHPDGSRVAYTYIYPAQEAALREVYQNFKHYQTSATDAPLAPEQAHRLAALQQRFQAFKNKNAAWLEPDALYEALSGLYQNDYWPQWQGPQAALDQRLFCPTDTQQAAEAQRRIDELKQQYADAIEAYKFTQFIASEQKNKFKAFADAQGLALMADRQVGFSDRDVWAYRDQFLSGWALGCPPDYFSKSGQAWGFPVLDPDKLFNPDGSLGTGGQLLRRLFDKIFAENPGGVRIDHIIGLIDPWVYPAHARSTAAGGRLYSSPEHPELSRYAFVGPHDLEQHDDPSRERPVRPEALSDEVLARYGRILDQIVLPAAHAHGITQDAIICEDLGTLTNPVLELMRRRGYSGIRVTQFVNPQEPHSMYRGRNAEAHHWMTPGTHDNEPLLKWSRDQITEGQGSAHAHMLADDVLPPGHDRGAFQYAISHDPLALARAKFVELFASPARQVQVFFADLFGQDDVYNKPGTHGHSNWALRVPQQFRDAYFNALQQGRGLNLPEILLSALQARQIHQPDLESQLAQLAQRLKQ